MGFQSSDFIPLWFCIPLTILGPTSTAAPDPSLKSHGHEEGFAKSTWKKIPTNTGSRPVLVLGCMNSTTIPSSAPCQQTHGAPFVIPAGVNPKILTHHPWWTPHGADHGCKLHLGAMRPLQKLPETVGYSRLL